MIRLVAILLGIGFIFIGVAGFLPSFKTDDLLFGHFKVDMILNVIHVVSGVIAIMASTSHKLSKLYFKLFGLIYALLTILGFVMHGDLSFMMTQVNMADNFLHAIIAIVAIYLGFFNKKTE
jgi:hypothetical protein